MRKEEESRKLTKVIFRLLNAIQMRGEGSKWLEAACKVSHVFSILAYLELNALEMLVDIQNQKALWSIIQVSLAVFSMIAVIGIAVVLAVEYRYYNEMGTLQQHKAILKVNAVAASGIYYTVEFVYFFGCILFFESLQMLSALAFQDYILLIFGSILFVVQSILVLGTRLFGRAAIFVGPILAFTGPILGVVLLFLLAGVLIYKEGSTSNRNYQLHRILYFIIALTCLWSFLQYEYTVFYQNIVAFLNLIFIGIAALGIYFLYPSLFVHQSTLQDNQQLLHWYKERSSGQSQNEDQVNLLQEQLYEKYFQEMEMFSNFCYSKLNIRQISVAGWKDADKARVLWERIKWARQNDNSFQMNLFYFRAGFSLKINATTLLKQLAVFLDKNRNLSLQNKYQIYKLNQQIFKYFQLAGNANDSALQIADVVEAQRYYHHFYQQLDLLLIQLVQFWKEVISNDFTINPEIQNKINAVSKLQNNAQKSLKKLRNYRIAEEERLFMMVSEIINCYRSGGAESSTMSKGEKVGSFQYVILEGDSVRKISLRLLKSLGYEPDSSEIYSMRSLLPVNFFGYLQEVERRFLAREQSQQFAIPVVQSSGCIVLKQCLMYVVPHWSCALQYLLSFHGVQAPNQIYILYNANKLKIEHFSEGFREFIGMKLDSFKEFSTGENVLFSSDVFQTELGLTELQILRAHQIIKTKIIYPDFYLRKNSLYNHNDEVTLNLEHQFSFGSQNYILLNVQSQSYRQVKLEAQQKSQSHIGNLNREKQLHQQYAHEEFFCRIENPYKSKIIQKLNGIRNRNYKSYFFQILVIKIFLLLLLIVNATVFNVISKMMMNNGYTITNVMFNLNNQYIYLLRLFSGTYSNFLFANDPTSSANYFNQTYFQGNATNADLAEAASKLSAYYQEFNDNNSRALMSTYLLYKTGVASHYQMNYSLVFSEFNITTNTMLTSFYDFIVKVEQGFSDGSAVAFLSQNYDSIMGIMPVYEQVDAFFNDYLSQYQLLKILGYVFIIALTTTIIISFGSTAKMINIHEQMHLLYKFVDRNDIRKILKELTIIQDAIGTIVDEENMHKTFDQVLTKKNLIDSRRDIPQSNHELRERNIRNYDSSNNKAEKEDQKFMNSVYKTFKYIYFCPILFATAWLVVYLEYSNMQQDQNDIHEALNLLQKLQSDQMHIEKFYNDFFQPRIYELKFGPYEQTIVHTVLKNQFYSEDLPSVFANDFFFEQNLCQTQYLSPINIPFFTRNTTDCNQMKLGILTDGYSGALQFYQSYIRDQAKLNFSDYLSATSTNKLREIIFLKELLYSYLKIKKSNFMNNFSIHINNSSTADINILIFTLIACSCLMVILLYNVITLRKKMHIVIDLICAIPSTAMYKIAMTNYIRNEGILIKMDKL